MNWEDINKRRGKYIRKYIRVFYRLLVDYKNDLINKLPLLTDVDNPEVILPNSNKDKLNNTILQLYKDVGINEYNNFDSYLIKAIKRNELQDIYIQELENYVVQNAAIKVVWVEETTKRIMLRWIREDIKEGVNQGLGISDIARNIEKTLNSLYVANAKKRALTIAQTEVIGASNLGSFMAAKQLDIPTKKRWIQAPAGVNKTERHRLLIIKDVDLNEPFDVDGEYLMFPGDPNGSAKNIINCKCTIGYIPL